MPYPIIWSHKAKTTYAHILKYLEDNWTQREVENFMLRTEKVLGFIGSNPYLYPYSQGGDVFKSVLTKQVSLFYRINQKSVELLLFWDTRQNPSKLRI